MIEVVDYDPAWPKQFASLRDRYQAALADVPVVAVEHVGSTSVPGLAAKPVIDIDIVVAAEHVPAATKALEAIGLRALGELGIEERWAFRAPPGPVRTNTYVIVAGCLALRNHLAVRDTLRQHDDLRDAYGSLKQRLGAALDDVDAYVEAKSPVLQQVLARAGLEPAELAAIEQANRR